MSSPAATAPDTRLGFTSQTTETPQTALEVRGELPPWLTGALVRTGPAQFEVGEKQLRHWFDGLAMLHAFSFGDGEVGYSSRFLETKARRAAERGRMEMQEFATDPCRSIFQRVTSKFSPNPTDNANVNVSRLGEEYIAMTETPLPVVFDPETLETVGFADRAPGVITTAHPHHDPQRGELVNYAAHLGPRSAYRIYADKGRGARRIFAEMKVSEPAYMHSFALSEGHVALVEFPLVVNPIKLALGGKPFIESYRWKPELGTRFRVFDRSTGELRGTWQGPAFFAFHHVNAFERDGELVLDLCAYEDAEVIRALYLEPLRAGQPVPGADLRRYRLPLDGGEVQVESLGGEGLELPRINYARCNGQPYRYVWGAGLSPERPRDFIARVLKLDLEERTEAVWEGEGCHPGEPVFVAAPQASAEDEGVLLSVVLDPARETSFLLVLDAANLDELARAQVPRHIPFGFHGQYFSSQ